MLQYLNMNSHLLQIYTTKDSSFKFAKWKNLGNCNVFSRLQKSATMVTSDLKMYSFTKKVT